MSKYITFFAVFVFLSVSAAINAQNALEQSVSELAKQISVKMSGYEITTIAVLEFTDPDGKVNKFGKYLAEELSLKLSDTKKFKVVDRDLLNKRIKEKNLEITGFIEPATAKQFAKLFDADGIVAGTFHDMGKDVNVKTKLLSSESGDAFSDASVVIQKDQKVKWLLAPDPVKELKPEAPKAEIPAPAPPPPPLPKPEIATPVSSNEIVVEMEGFTYKVISCRVVTRIVELKLQICNITENNLSQSIYGSYSEIYDNLGNKYNLSSVIMSKEKSSYRVHNNFLPSIPVNFTLTIDDFSENATSFTISLKTERKNVVIKDIPIPWK